MVDSAAKRATTFDCITDKSSLPPYDYKNHYRLLIFIKMALNLEKSTQ